MKRGATMHERACDVGEATVHATRTNGACRRSGYMMREGMLFLATQISPFSAPEHRLPCTRFFPPVPTSRSS